MAIPKTWTGEARRSVQVQLATHDHQLVQLTVQNAGPGAPVRVEIPRSEFTRLVSHVIDVAELERS